MPDSRYAPPPDFKFPGREFGTDKRIRRCQASWFVEFTWLHYVPSKDYTLCFECRLATDRQLLRQTGRPIEETFITTGFSYWNDGRKRMKRHQDSQQHREAKECLSQASAGTNIVETLRGDTVQGERNRKLGNRMLLLICRALRYLAVQNVAIRGRTYQDEDGNSHEPNSNFRRLLDEFAIDNAELREWLTRNTNNYTSPRVQTELLELMNKHVQLAVAARIKSGPYTIMMDETTDINNHEQLVLCLRWVDTLTYEAHEEFIGMYRVPDTCAATLVAMVKKVLISLDIPLENCHGQCYDGAAAMSGKRSGVATQLQMDNPKAVYIHCYGHSVNLAIQDTMKESKPARESLDTVAEICKLISRSPKRNEELEKVRLEAQADEDGDEDGDENICFRKIRTFCPTR